MNIGMVIALIKKLGVTPDPAVIESAVNDYLEEHPEAVAPIDDTAGDGDTDKIWSADKTWTETSELKEAIAKIGKEAVGSSPAYTEVVGKYITDSGVDYAANSFNRSDPIPVSKGDIISFRAKGYQTSVAMIALSDEAGTSFTVAVLSVDSTVRDYSYTALDDGYYVVSYNKNSEHILTQYTETTGKVLDTRLDAYDLLKLPEFVDDADFEVTADGTSATMTTGYYITNGGDKVSGQSYNMSADIALAKGDVIKFNAKGYSTNVSVLAQDNGDNTYYPLIVSEDSNEHTFRYMAEEAMNVVISTHKSVSPVYSKYTSQINRNDLRITDIENDFDCVAFATMGVIGDSLASGASNHGSSGAEDRKNYSWGKYIEREHGISVSLFSVGGLTTRLFFTDSNGLAAMNNADPLDCYVIGLGVNDKSEYGASYLGSVSDVHVGSEDQNADTFYGNYSKIIAAIKTKSPRAKIFCLNNPRAVKQSATGFNDAISDIVDMYENIWLVDLESDSFYTSRVFNTCWVGVHSTALGYKQIGRNIYKHISDIVKANMGDFLDIQWIVVNHQ